MKMKYDINNNVNNENNENNDNVVMYEKIMSLINNVVNVVIMAENVKVYEARNGEWNENE